MTITERAASIKEHDRTVADLETRAKNTNKRREEAKRKNKALQSLRAKLENIQSGYETLRKWQSLGDVMEVSYNPDAVEDLKRDMEADLRTITDTDFEGFEDAQEIRDLEEDFTTHHQKLNDRQRIIQNHIEERCEELLEELSTKLTVLRIPDVGSEEDETVIEEFQDFLRAQKQGDLHQNPATRYEELEAAYGDVEISFEAVQEEYDIGDEAMEELKKLLNNERVTLANIDEPVLNDLKNLSEFSQLLTIQFTEDN
jgi:hypothetical protein